MQILYHGVCRRALVRQTKLDSEYLSNVLHCCAADTTIITGRETYTVKLIVEEASGGSGVKKRGADN